MNGVLAEYDSYLFITVCDHLELKGHSAIEGGRGLTFSQELLEKNSRNYVKVT